jgi:hypothetical protein
MVGPAKACALSATTLDESAAVAEADPLGISVVHEPAAEHAALVARSFEHTGDNYLRAATRSASPLGAVVSWIGRWQLGGGGRRGASTWRNSGEGVVGEYRLGGEGS